MALLVVVSLYCLFLEREREIPFMLEVLNICVKLSQRNLRELFANLEDEVEHPIVIQKNKPD
jgi:hypothetical protein